MLLLEWFGSFLLGLEVLWVLDLANNAQTTFVFIIERMLLPSNHLLETSGLFSTRAIVGKGFSRHKQNFLSTYSIVSFTGPLPLTLDFSFLPTQGPNFLLPRVSHRIFFQVSSEGLHSINLAYALSAAECLIWDQLSSFFCSTLPLSICYCRFACLNFF